MGVMQPSGAAGLDLEPDAWGGRFPVHAPPPAAPLPHPTPFCSRPLVSVACSPNSRHPQVAFSFPK
eukprot:6199922-Pleurochrysis_carterae.AAC.4